MGTLTKADLVAAVAAATNLPPVQAKVLVESFFELLTKQLESGVPVKLSGFGNFELKDKRARPGRNPKTGEAALISARRVVTFKAGLKLKEAVR